MSFVGLQVAASFMRSSRLGLEVSGRNLSGAEEPGYTRQEIRPTEQVLSTQGGFQGKLDTAGSRVAGIERQRDQLLDQVYRVRTQEAEEAKVLDGYLTDLENLLGGPENLNRLIRNVEDSLLAVSDDPSDLAIRTDLLSRADQVTVELRTAGLSLDRVRANALDELGQQVDRVNTILGELAGFNQEINAAGQLTAGGNELLDQRDRLLDELSGLAEVRNVIHPNGRVSVYMASRQLLDQTEAETLSLTTTGDLVNSNGDSMNLRGGSLASLRDFVFTRMPALQGELDAVATSLITQFNQIHGVGYDLTGTTGRDFFSGAGASDIRLAVTDPRFVAAGVSTLESPQPLGPAAAPGPLDPRASLASQGASGALTTAPAASGTLDINGTAVTWSDTDSLDSVLENINQSGAGVIASYDRLSRKILLTRDPAVPGPSTITVNDTVGNLTAVLNLPSGAPSGAPGPGDGSLAQLLSQRLREPLFGPSGSRPLAESYADLLVGVGNQRQTLTATIERRSNAQASAEARRRESTGVNSDDELLKIIRYQQSFAAAARLASASDQLITTILNELGR